MNADWRYKTDMHHEFSVLDFSNLPPQTAQIKLVSTFKFFGGGGGGRGTCPRTPPPSLLLEISSFFFISNSRLCLYSCLKEFLEMESEPMLTQRGEFPSTRGSDSEEVWTCNTVSPRTVSPKQYQLSYSSPLLAPRFELQLLSHCGSKDSAIVYADTSLGCTLHVAEKLGNQETTTTTTKLPAVWLHNFSSSSVAFPSYISEVHHFQWDFCVWDHFFNSTI